GASQMRAKALCVCRRNAIHLTRAGQRRTKSPLIRQERCFLWRVPVARDGQGRSYADKTLLLWPLLRQGRQANWRRTMDKGGQNGDEGTVIGELSQPGFRVGWHALSLRRACRPPTTCTPFASYSGRAGRRLLARPSRPTQGVPAADYLHALRVLLRACRPPTTCTPFASYSGRAGRRLLARPSRPTQGVPPDRSFLGRFVRQVA